MYPHRYLLALATILLLIQGCRPGTDGGETDSGERPNAGISLADSLVRRVAIPSLAMRTTLNAYVLLPESYYLDSTLRFYPVAYLLHGHGGDFSNWYTYVPDLQALASRYDMIIVTPEGGTSSWYLDSPLDSASRYETYIGQETPVFIDRHFRTRRQREGRAIGGLSMGGHGAFFLGLRHPETFAAAGSLSGVLDLQPYGDQWEIARHLGGRTENPDQWAAYSVTNLLKGEVPDVALYIDCGTDDFLIADNRAVHQQLLEQGIPHVYTERPGGHTWAYWGEAVAYLLVFFDRVFEEEGF
jgi:S-formylglutathione hydrolase FrmB